MSGGGGTTTTSTSTAEPPEFVIPFSEELLERASALSQTPFAPPLPSGAQRVAPFGPDLELARQLTRERALSGSPATSAAQDFIVGNLGNLPFDPITNQIVNTAQGNIVDQFNTNIAPSTAARFQRSGNLDSTAFGETDASQRFNLARALGDVEGGIRADARQFGAGLAGLAPTIAEQDFRNLSALAGVGQQQQGIDQAIKDVDFANLLQQRQEPLQQLDVLRAGIATAQGGFGTTSGTFTQPSSGNPFLTGLGAAGSIGGALIGK